MSDFLANLAARSFSSVAPIQPRVAALFEPVRADVPSLRTPDRIMNADEEPAFAAAESESAPVRVSRHRAPAPTRKARRAPALETVSDNFRTEEPRPSERISSSQPPQPRPDWSPAAPVQVRAIRAVEPAWKSTEQNLPAASPDLEISAASAAAVATPPPRETDNQEAVPGNNRVMASLAPPAPARERVFEPLPDLRARHDREPARLGTAAAADSEPSIQVTIGRVEVRAATAGASARRVEPAASPVMSLDEYLSRQARRGGA
jgi:hypothetical protein